MTRVGLFFAVVLAALSVSTTSSVKIHLKYRKDASTTSSSNSSTTTSTNSSSWSMTEVVAYQARIQGNAPIYDSENEAWVASYGSSFAAKYRSVLDSVNTASIEGALMYLQAEGINSQEQSVKCQRKNNMQYIVFYKLKIVQPTGALAYYAGKHEPSEYCPFVAMDSGMCTPSGTTIPDTCKQYDGLNGQPKLGHCVGANEQSTDPRAPYPGNYWFSYPNSCVTKAWSSKDDTCRTQYPGGLCAFGTEPDGVNCTFSYSILGYLNIDDLVGITDGSALSSGVAYNNFTTFCQAGNVEFSATNTGNGFKVTSSIPFWEDPGNSTANSVRAQKMIAAYNAQAKKNATMEALPELSSISNPPCYKNSKECATASKGCRRTLYAQLCEVCTTASSDCEVAPSSFKFPDLPIPKGTSSSSSSSSTAGDSAGNSSSSNADTEASSAAAGGRVSMLAAIVSGIAAVFITRM